MLRFVLTAIAAATISSAVAAQQEKTAATKNLTREATATSGVSTPPVITADYRIGEGDIISVSVWREADASAPMAVVRPDGKVSLPLIKELYIAGMTPAEAETAVARQLSAFINKPEVAVVVREIHSKRVYVVGAAKKEGPVPYTYRMTVLQAISEAGGLTDYAKRKKIYVLRTENGKQRKLPFNYDAVVKGEQMDRNVELQPGDTLVIPN